MSDIKISDLQTDLCTPEVVEPTQKFCPTCVPNPNAPIVRWEEEPNPFLNERTCEYQVSVTIDEDGIAHSPADLEKFATGAGGNAALPWDFILRKYVRPGVREILRHYNKIESDDLVCAFPPSESSPVCGSLWDIMSDDHRDDLVFLKKIEVPTEDGSGNTFDVYTLDAAALTHYKVPNPQALELFALAKDYAFGDSPHSPVKVLVSIPAFVIDNLAESPATDDLIDMAAAEKVILTGQKFKMQCRRLKIALRTYGGFQAYWFQTERGQLRWNNNPRKKFHIKKFSETPMFFYDNLKELLDENDYRLSRISTLKTAHKIKIVFNNENEKNPYEVKAVYAKYKDCRWQKMKKGFRAFKKRSVVKNKTVMGYIARIREIDEDLRAKETPPWLDFILEYTYPSIDVVWEADDMDQYGAASPLACIAKNQGAGGGALKDYFLEEVVTLVDSIAYQFNKNACKALNNEKIGVREQQFERSTKAEELKLEREMTGALEELNKVMLEGDLYTEEEFKAEQEKLEKSHAERLKAIRDKKLPGGANASRRNTHPYMKYARESALKSFDIDSSLVSLFMDKESLLEDGFGALTPSSIKRRGGFAPRDVLGKLDLCGLSALMKKALECLMGGMTLEEAYKLAVRAALETMSMFNMERLWVGLDYEQQLKIQETVQKAIGDMPAPWEWDEGEGAGQSKQLRAGKYEDFKENQQEAEDNVKSNSAKIEELKSKIEATQQAYDSVYSGEILSVQSTQSSIAENTAKVRALEQDQISLQKEVSELKAELDLWEGLSENEYLAGVWNSVYEKEGEIEIIKEDLKSLRAKVVDLDAMLKDFQTQADALMNEIKEFERQIESLEKDSDTVKGEVAKQRELLDGLSDEEIASLIEENEDYKFAQDADPNQAIKSGTIGKAAGQIQQAVTQAYIEAIMEVVGVDTLLRLLDRFPGAKLISRFIQEFDCPMPPLFYPPIDGFLSTLTFDPCGPNRGSIALPKINTSIFKISWLDLMSALWESIKKAIEKIVIMILNAALVKILQILEDAICKALEGVGKLAGNLATGQFAEKGGLRGVLMDTLCGAPDASEDEGLGVTSAILSSIGVVPSAPMTDITTPQETTSLPSDISPTANTDQQTNYMKDKHMEVARTISLVATENEMKALIVAKPGRQDVKVLSAISQAVSAYNPEFAEIFEDPQNVSDIFGAIGDMMSPEQRQAVRNELSDPAGDLPIERSICMTKDELDDWNNQRRQIFEDSGVSPELAKDWVDKLNDRVRSDFLETAKLASKGIGETFQEELDKALGDGGKDPVCKDAASFIDLEPTQEIARLNDITAEKMFAKLSQSYRNDLVGKRNAFLDYILSDTLGKPLRIHERRANFTFLYPTYANSQKDYESKLERLKEVLPDFIVDWMPDDAEGVFPDTVGIHMQKQLMNNEFAYETKTEYKKARVINKEQEFQPFGFGSSLRYRIPPKKEADLVLKFRDRADGRAESEDDFQFGCNVTYQSYRMIEKDDVDQMATDLSYRVQVQEVNKAVAIDPNTGEPLVETVKQSQYNRMSLNIKNGVPSGTQDLIDGFEFSETDILQPKYSHSALMFHAYVDQIWDGFTGGIISVDKSLFAKTVFDGVSSKMFEQVSKLMVETPDGDTPQGFKFGYNQESAISFGDLTYVNPEANPDDDSTWEYTYDEEEKVLGKSATENPRVHFLDPEFYGGWYGSPKIYIEPADHDGWLGLTQVMVPEIDGCKPKRTDFIDFETIVDRVREVESSLPHDKRLSYDPDCLRHVPFDKIAASSTHGQIEGTLKATIRIYVSEFIIRTLPVLSMVKLNPGENYDSGVDTLILEEMAKNMIDRGNFFSGRVSNYNYWLLFLEQAVQAVQRRLDAGTLEYNSEIEEATQAIRKAQKDHFYPFLEDMEVIRQLQQSDRLAPGATRASAIGMGISLCALGPIAVSLVGGVGILGALIGLRSARFASHIYTIWSVERHCKTLLKYLIKEEMSFFADKLQDNMSPPAKIASLKKYYIGGSNSMVGSTLKCGTTEIEEPISEGQTGQSYGDALDVSSDVTAENPLDGIAIPDDVATKGGFFVEKYIRLIDKSPGTTVPSWIMNRNAALKGVVSVRDFKSFLSANEENWHGEGEAPAYLSDLFGNAVVSEDGTSLEGSIGVKFGVRLMMIPPDAFSPQLGISVEMEEKAQSEKAYKVVQAEGGGLGTRYIFPVASYETDILDRPISELDLGADNMGEDLKCYIDALVKTDEFSFLFDACFPLTRVSSLVAIYSYYCFLASVGEDASERDKEENRYQEPDDSLWREGFFEDTKDIAYRMFKSIYNTDDYEESDDSEDVSLKEFLKENLPALFTNLDPSVAWWQRWKIKSRPYNKDGESCLGEFGSLISKE